MRVLWVCARVVLGVGVVVEGVPCVTARVRVRACALGVCAYWRVVFVWLCCGGVLLSHDLSIAVPLALPGLASRFGMLLGVSPVL